LALSKGRFGVSPRWAEINRFLTDLAVNGHVSASTQNQAFSALLFLYQKVLEVDPGRIAGVVRANRPKRLPVVLTRAEVTRVLTRMADPYRLMAELMYGSGLRLLECLRLRVKDLDPDRKGITVREGKGNKDRRTMLPAAVWLVCLARLAHRQCQLPVLLFRARRRRLYPGRPPLAWGTTATCPGLDDMSVARAPQPESSNAPYIALPPLPSAVRLPFLDVCHSFRPPFSSSCLCSGRSAARKHRPTKPCCPAYRGES
jgi:integrase